MTSHVQCFGSAVRQLREQHQWSQELLAERADLNRSYIGEIERGQTVPSLLTLHKLATALGVSASSLLSHSERIAQHRSASGIELTSIAC